MICLECGSNAGLSLLDFLAATVAMACVRQEGLKALDDQFQFRWRDM
jgi:hypothetical protein